MRTVRRLLLRDIGAAVAFVTVAFVALFFFIDFVDELDDIGRGGWTLGRAALYTLLRVPGRLVELLPITVLIGAIHAMSRLAQSSEFTILRTAGLAPGRALRMLAGVGLAFALLTAALGEWIVPVAERSGAALRASTRGVGVAGAWLKEQRAAAGGADARSVAVNVRAARGADGRALDGVQIFEFDAQGRLRTRLDARQATVGDDGAWRLEGVERTDWPTPAQVASGETGASAASAVAPGVARTRLDALRWPSTLAPSVVAAALRPGQAMGVLDLWRYASHLGRQAQSTQRIEIRFWQKALYPLACVVMIALALPFGYLHARTGNIGLKVFGGILLGISFVLLNAASGHLGALREWTPWIAAATPSALYLMLAMGAFWWLVRYR